MTLKDNHGNSGKSIAGCIITVTVNPSVDHAIELDSPLEHGQVQRYSTTHIDAAGKGVNVSKAILEAGMDTTAFFPAAPADAYVKRLESSAPSLRFFPIATRNPVRTNVTITEPDGTTTKLNSAGTPLEPETQEELIQRLLAYIEKSPNVSWIVLAGSLPRGTKAELYSSLITRLRKTFTRQCPRLAVDTSGKALAALFEDSVPCYPDLIKPNGAELAELLGYENPISAEERFQEDPLSGAKTALDLMEKTRYQLNAILLTLGAHGAVFVTYDQEKGHAWYAKNAPVQAKSTVGAGDSSLAGLIMAHTRAETPENCLKNAVAYGTAAACLPGTAPPTPQDLNYDTISMEKIL